MNAFLHLKSTLQLIDYQRLMKRNGKNKNMFNSLKESYVRLLLEGVANSDVKKAIEERKVVYFYYDGGKSGVSGDRECEIYAFGVTRAGNQCIRAYQISGASKTGAPSWKLFLLDKMNNFKITENTFDSPRDGFNPNGDKGMATVYRIVKFDEKKSGGLLSRIKRRLKSFFGINNK